MAKGKGFDNLLERLVPILLLASIILAFVVGVLWQKVNFLEGKGSKVAGTEAAAGDNNEQPAIRGKLSEEQTKKIPPVNSNDRIRGSQDAEVYLIEYSDLECPYCKKFHPTAKQAVEEYKGKLAWVWRDFPLDQLHSKADKEAEAAWCAYEQGGNDKFWAYIDKVFEVTPSNNGLNLDELPKIADEIGLDQGKFNSCLTDGKYKDQVEQQYQGGVGIGVSGTPANIIMNKKGEAWLIPGALPYESVQVIVDEAIKS